MANGKRWTDKELEFLRTNYNNMSVSALADKLQRTYSSINSKMGKLGLVTRNTKHEFTPYEVSFIVENYKTLGAKKCGEMLNIDSSVVKYFALNTLNIQCFESRSWTKKEDDFIKANYPTRGCQYCAEKLDRSTHATYKRAESLGVKNEPKHFHIDYQGYKRVVIPEEENRVQVEHRVIMERHLGRKLASTEIVHHIDGDKLNNSLDNLVITTRADHANMHREVFRRKSY